MKKEKTKFRWLKPGQKFKYKRCLYVKDKIGYPVRLSDGKILMSNAFSHDSLVTPVKIKITETKT